MSLEHCKIHMKSGVTYWADPESMDWIVDRMRNAPPEGSVILVAGWEGEADFAVRTSEIEAVSLWTEEAFRQHLEHEEATRKMAEEVRGPDWRRN